MVCNDLMEVLVHSVMKPGLVLFLLPVPFTLNYIVQDSIEVFPGPLMKQ